MSVHQLIGAPVSYYTGKVRAYLNFKQIPYEETLSSDTAYKDIILPRVGFPIIPVVVTDEGETLQDSTDIIDAFEDRYPEPSIYPRTPLQRLVALLLEVYGDEWLVIPAMHYRWNLPENRENAVRRFGATAAPDADPQEQLEIGQSRATRFAGMVPNLGITETNQGAIEASYLQLLSDFDAHLAEHPFLLGSRPSIGDYGLIGPLYAHQYLDPASGRIMEAHAPRVADWVRRTHDPERHDGEFLDGDAVPETLLPLLGRMAREHIPVLMSTARHVADWAAEHPGERKIPRAIGTHPFTMEGVTEHRAIFPANLWMWQRAHDFYNGLDDESRDRARTLLASFPELIEALETPIPQRIVRENFRFMLEER